MNATASRPEISVIIPTMRNDGMLRRALQSLADCEFEASRLEVIVIDDGHADATEEVVRSVGADSGLACRYLRSARAGRGPGIASNVGLAAATGDVIAFTDDDCVVDRQWLKAIAEAAHAGATVMSGETWCDEVLIFPWKNSPAGQRGITANLAINRRLVGDFSFDERYEGMVGHDTEMIRRLGQRGFDVTEVPQMRVFHLARRSRLGPMVRRARWRRNEVRLYRDFGAVTLESLNPLLRPYLFGRVSYATAGVVVGLAAVILAFRWPFLWAVLAAVLFVFTAWFILSGYRLCIRYVPAGPWTITYAERWRTLLSVAVYLPCFVAARVVGSWKERFLLL